MHTNNGGNSSERLSRLYDLKREQMERHQRQGETLQYRVLAAEMEAISSAIRHQRSIGA